MSVSNNGNLKLAIQKKGRLTEKSIELIKLCGVEIDNYSERLVVPAYNFPLEILFLRDDDIPEYVQDGVADIGIVGENVLVAKNAQTRIVEKLGFGKCSLMMAAPENISIKSVKDIEGKTIATSFPRIVQNYLTENKINAKIIEISGSVEIAPALGVADIICDIVSTGNTLMMNKLKKSISVFESQAVLISSASRELNPQKKKYLDELHRRIKSVLTAKNSRYLMMNVPKSSLEKIEKVIPSIKSPTILPLADEKLVAVHAVIPSGYLWKIVDSLKSLGATGILLLPIENMIP
ncbi:MAG: ATP phosphoribosyltransferase [Ignavibacteriaceae bacterium]|nr:ATP phosphoribosyltransferase [Ignavibacteriaceae bacterium]